MSTPRYQHNCYLCQFLGIVDGNNPFYLGNPEQFDLYFCPGTEGGGSVIARYGVAGEYMSCPIESIHQGSQSALIWAKHLVRMRERNADRPECLKIIDRNRKNLVRFWVSWGQPIDPNTEVNSFFQNADCTISSIGRVVQSWFITATDTHAILCTVVDALDQEGAKKVIEETFTPKGVSVSNRIWRFCEEREADWMPDPDRFPAE